MLTYNGPFNLSLLLHEYIILSHTVLLLSTVKFLLQYSSAVVLFNIVRLGKNKLI
jgi:hypothetical protein